MLTLKVTTVGASAGFILPKEARDRLGVQKGDTVYLTPAPGGWRITACDPDFAEDMELAEKIRRKYRNALKELAK